MRGSAFREASVDQILFAQIGLVVAVLGVIGTFIAPRLVPSSRVHLEALDISQIARRDPTERIKVRVLHDDVVVDGPVYMVRSQISNVGNRDITRSEFIEPVQIRLPSGSEILSVDIDSAEGVGAECVNAADRSNIRWAILKPNESISVKIIFSNLSVESVPRKDALKLVSFVARLRDVKVGLGIKKYARQTTAAIIAVVIAVIFVATFQVVSFFGSERWVYTDQASSKTFAVRDPDWPLRGQFELCEVSGGKVTTSCLRITKEQAREAISKADRIRMSRELDPILLAILIVIALAYGSVFSTAASGFLRSRKILKRRFKVEGPPD